MAKLTIVRDNYRHSVGMLKRVRQQDDTVRELAFANPLEEALFDLQVGRKEN